MNYSRLSKTIKRNIYAQLLAIAIGTILGVKLIELIEPHVEVRQPIDHKCIPPSKVITD